MGGPPVNLPVRYNAELDCKCPVQDIGAVQISVMRLIAVWLKKKGLGCASDWELGRNRSRQSERTQPS